MSDNPLAIGTQIGLLTGYATAHCALATSMLHAHVVAETEKAVQLEAIAESGASTGQKVWLPRKAIRVKRCTDRTIGDYVTYDLAKWFKPDGYTARFFQRHVHTSFLSA